MGSVKDLQLLEPAYENKPGVGNFVFSDRFSVFDWGEMPDQIKGKGAALAVMSAYNFEKLHEQGIPSHYRTLILPDGSSTFNGLMEEEGGSNVMCVDMGVRYDPTARRVMGEDGKPQVDYDYSFFDVNRGKLNNFLVPLEIIFRNGLPKGSSVFRKLRKVSGNPEKMKGILGKLGLIEVPSEGDMLPETVVDYTTKLEEGDRVLTEDEAYKISGLTEEEFGKIKPFALRVNYFVTERAKLTGLAPHWDGKVEMVYRNGLVLADVVGTPDEDRFGDRMSKEFLRQWYDKNQPGWHEACDEWKKTGEGWQDRCPVKPVKLPPELSTLVSQMYQSACNQYVGREIFPDVPELGGVMERLKPFRD